MNRLSILAFALLVPGLASAVILTPDDYTYLPGTTLADRPELAGTVLEDDLVAFSFSAYGGTVSGTVQNRVVRTNAGTLDFYWRVISDADSAGVIGDLRLVNFFTETYDADWRIDGSGDTAPTYGYLFDRPGGFVNFDFRNLDLISGGLEPGAESYFFFLHTDATEYARTASYDLTNFGQNEISGLYATYAPVPEPASMAALGLGALALLRRRRKA